MWRNNKKYIALTVAIVAIVVLAIFYRNTIQIAYEAHACEVSSSQNDVRINCWYDILKQQMHASGIPAAMHSFAFIYDHYPHFAESGCHVHAHRVGDMAYYEMYRANPDFDAMDFPQETVSCGYGFFHGFFEHLIQDHPSAKFITQTCDYFQKRLGSSMGSIREICYHGSGHGLMLAQAERVPKSQWGIATAFTRPPLKECETLTEALSHEKEECREGVYNVLVDWMESTNFGFTFDDAHPFALCDVETNPDWKYACYYEMAQKLDSISKYNPNALVGIVSKIADHTLRHLAFDVGVLGMLQPDADTDQYKVFMQSCVTLPDEYREECVTSVVSGLFEHGPPQQEYQAALKACALPEIEQGQLAKACWDEVSVKLLRFYTPQRAGEICAQFPAQYKPACTARVAKASPSN